MERIVTAAEMAALDRRCISELAMPGLLLMENAGAGIARIAREMLGPAPDGPVLIVCGPGNNGGDGYVVARHLANAGCRVDLWILAAEAQIRGDARTNLTIWQRMGGQTRFIDGPPAPPAAKPHLIIDALLGTGARTDFPPPWEALIEMLNSMEAPILAVDLPTGVDAETGAVRGAAIQASATATMARLKPGLLFSPGRECAGRVYIVDIGMPPELQPPGDHAVFRLDAAAIAARLPQRSPDTHKNRVGLVGVVAGSAGYTGAACLTAMAALRAGCGLAYLAAPRSLQPVYAARMTEVITWPVEDGGRGCLTATAWPEWRSRLAAMSALAMGPGLGTHAETGALVHALLSELELPLVLDADGLNLVGGRPERLQHYRGPLILTPHPGEFSRLSGLPVAEIRANPVAVAGEWAVKIGHILVLKGGPSVIAAPDGRVFVNATGNAGMATAGSGDVLTGLIAGLLAQGAAPLDAALSGVWLHGAAGDLAREAKGEMGLIAGDLIDYLPAAVKGCLASCP